MKRGKRKLQPVDWEALKPFLPKTSRIMQEPPHLEYERGSRKGNGGAK